MPQDIYIEMGEQPQALIRRYGEAIDVNDKNFGLKFYMVNWPTRQPGSVLVKTARSEVRIDIAYGASGTYNTAYPDEGLSSYDVSCGLSLPETMPHDQARLKFFELLGRIQKAGWKRLIYQTQPRLNGADALRYQLESSSGSGSLDPDFVLSLQDWMKLENRTPWKFYKDEVYMDIRLSRDPKRMKTEEPGAYFISISLESYQSFWRTTFKETERGRWRDLLPEARERQHATRADVEKKLEAEGYKIDITYRDPDENFSSTSPPEHQGPATQAPPSPPASAPTRTKGMLSKLRGWLDDAQG